MCNILLEQIAKKASEYLWSNLNVKTITPQLIEFENHMRCPILQICVRSAAKKSIEPLSDARCIHRNYNSQRDTEGQV